MDDFEPLSPQPPEVMSPSQNESETDGKAIEKSITVPENESLPVDSDVPEQVSEINDVAKSMSETVTSTTEVATVDGETAIPSEPGQLIAEGSVEEIEVAEE